MFKAISTHPRFYFAISLIMGVIGLTQIASDLLSIPALKAIATASLLSPAPKVFSSVQGLETFTSKFSLVITNTDGSVKEVLLTPQIYSRLSGSYNRRNVYGAILAYGPVLSTSRYMHGMFEAVLRSALCGERPLLKELALIDAVEDVASVTVVIHPKHSVSLPLMFTPECTV